MAGSLRPPPLSGDDRLITIMRPFAARDEDQGIWAPRGITRSYIPRRALRNRHARISFHDELAAISLMLFERVCI